MSAINAISPLDGRYTNKLTDFNSLCSEFALIKFRLTVEVEWFKALSRCEAISELPLLSKQAMHFLNNLLSSFNEHQAEQVKLIERTTNHDVKAVEYFLKEQFQQNDELKPYGEFIHFGCTSEDINNLAYGLMLKSLKEKILEQATELQSTLRNLAKQHASLSMLSRTHGQAATPTTLGKELANFAFRLERQIQRIKRVELLGKCNGAVGNFNAHLAAYPEVDWQALSKQFIEELGLIFNSYTTQIEPHDYIAELCQAFHLHNIILIDLSRDCWTYISLGYFTQQNKAKEVGSSTMPHKINPIDFENAEGNLGLANSLLSHFAGKLPISRLQRDLSDSTVLRNLGSAFAYSSIAYQALLKGLNKLQANEQRIKEDLNQHWEVLAEPIQTVMRRYGIANPYEQLKQLTKGQQVTAALLKEFIQELALPETVKDELLKLTPENYIGLASLLAQQV
jgi:adenylosuccinate lyase